MRAETREPVALTVVDDGYCPACDCVDDRSQAWVAGFALGLVADKIGLCAGHALIFEIVVRTSAMQIAELRTAGLASGGSDG